MNKSRLAAAAFAIAMLAAGAWLWLSSRPSFGYELVQAYRCVAGDSAAALWDDGLTMAVLILSRPAMWLFFGCAIVAISACKRTLVVFQVVLAGLFAACIVAPQACGVVLLGLNDSSMLGGISFLLPGAVCVVVDFIGEDSAIEC